MQNSKVIAFPGAPKPQKECKEKRARRADGLIQVEHRYTDLSGKPMRKVFYGKTYQEADKKRRAFRVEVEGGMNPEAMTVATYADAWLKTYKSGLRPRTYRTDRKSTRLNSSH